MWAAVWGRCATHRSLAKLVSSYRFRAYTPPVAVAEFDEATSPANTTIPVAMRAAGTPLRDRSRPLKHIKTQKPAYKHMNFYKCLTALCCARFS